MKIKYKKLNDKATIPTKGSPKAAGYDLCSLEAITLIPGQRYLFRTGLSFEIPEGMYGRIAPRSGLALKSGIDVLAGVIDEDYRGEIGVIIINFGDVPKLINIGDKIAQIIFETYHSLEFVNSDELSNTTRNQGGYGSTDNPQKQASARREEGFKLGQKTTIEKGLPSEMWANASFRLMRHDGEIYSCTEKGIPGICVVDSSGQVLDKFFV